MCALIAMAVYSTEENKKDECLKKTLESLKNTVDFSKHRLMLSVNGFTNETVGIILSYDSILSGVFWNGSNLGTAEAINKIWKERLPNENAIKMDDDVVIHQPGWVDLLEEGISRDPDKIGILCLKRKDLAESPNSENAWYKSELKMLPHIPGHRWIIIEVVQHCMGTVQMYNSRLIDKIGGLVQMDGLYGFDDSLAAVRCEKAGFISAFLHGVEIDHIDNNITPYTTWKEQYAGKMLHEFHKTKAEYLNGTRNINYPL